MVGEYWSADSIRARKLAREGMCSHQISWAVRWYSVRPRRATLRRQHATPATESAVFRRGVSFRGMFCAYIQCLEDRPQARLQSRSRACLQNNDNTSYKPSWSWLTPGETRKHQPQAQEAVTINQSGFEKSHSRAIRRSQLHPLRLLASKAVGEVAHEK